MIHGGEWQSSSSAQGGRVRLCYFYQYCEDFPPPGVLTTAARLI